MTPASINLRLRFHVGQICNFFGRQGPAGRLGMDTGSDADAYGQLLLRLGAGHAAVATLRSREGGELCDFVLDCQLFGSPAKILRYCCFPTSVASFARGV